MQVLSIAGGNFVRRYRVALVAGGATAVCLVPRGDTTWLFGVGNTLLVAGLLLRTWAAGIIRKNTAVATHGPYALWRHPLYTGSMLVGLGLSFLSGVWWMPMLVGLVLASYLDRLMGYEEQNMYRWASAIEVQDFLATRGRWMPRLTAGSLPQLQRGWSWRRCVYGNAEWQAWAGVTLLWFFRTG